MKAEDLPLLWSVSSPSVSPDGSTIAFSATHPDLDADAAVGQIFTVPADGRAPESRLTRGFRDTAPSYSPDGTLLAFLRAGSKDAPQLYVVPSSGGEALQLTDRTLGVAAFEWAPDGASIAFSSRVPEHGRYGTVEGLEAPAEAPRHFTSVRYKSNGTGYIRDRRTQLFVVTIADVDAEPSYPAAPSVDDRWGTAGAGVPEARQLTSGDADHAAFSWLPDSTGLVVAAALHDSRESDLLSQLYSVYLSGLGTPTRLTPAGSTLAVGSVVVTPSGSIYFTAQDMGESHSDFVGRSTGVFLLDGSTTTRLTPVEQDFGEAGQYLSAHGADAVLAVERSRGTSRLHSVSTTGTEVLAEGAVITGQACAGATIAVAFSTSALHSEIAVIDDTGLDLLTEFQTLAPVETAEFTVTARDGYPVHGWVSVPAGEGPHPTLLMIHGGPFASYYEHFFDEVEVLADAGYAVVYCNPRGSAGYGEDHGRAIIERMGTLDHFDVLDFLDGALASNERLDATRLGILGGSYGGYLTAWTIAHDHRFAAAIVERGFLDPEVFPGTSDIGDFFGREYLGSDIEGMRAQSPQAVVASVTTPTFVIHSEQDLRCPLGQAERYFASLQAQGVESELLIFPGENHELSRSGRPRHRVQRFEAILDWFGRHIPVGAPTQIHPLDDSPVP
jgi:dipeptidyl aminopeptidase/acylaminoacyl peptidase